ncbi:lipopolysaccharide transport periplasmic protein LptA [Diaphorobacter sp. HDW4A]|uniref:lipopolysaccharide transport periplasmic protein LptA n=1 Tax=Diaphorobacter sp. HDW4A TaxID=2714924 RepID=UPI0014094E1B|nr:lipopolysaccharide transport periplasmic protein LptA [Diaphorobacter sp. HDW4A]QIL82127.1 lipopolysaccharide transport periplasmic protein LptA [Diaphorobacter sp. HDW4A]
MKTRLIPLLFSCLLALGPAVVHAERADRDKPMNIEADTLRHDELKQLSVFTGNVVMTKGTIVLRGAQLEVRQDPEGFQFGTVTAAAGKRAFFRQKRDSAPGAPHEYVEGEGEVIEYDGKADIVKFIRRGELRRYRDTAMTDQVNGALIVYNNITDVFTVDGVKNNPSAQTTAGTPSGRVRMTLTPKEKPADGEAQTSKPERNGEPPVLRSSPELSNGGGK